MNRFPGTCRDCGRYVPVGGGNFHTGKEREETLRFVHECEEHWAVHVVWLEWSANDPGYQVVTFETAARNGEPLSGIIAKKGFLPNAVTRFCTIEAKVRTMKKFMQRGRGVKRWVNAVGLRHDEGHRCLKAYARNASNKEPFTTVLPLDKARVTKADVTAFWRAQNFDLQLKSYEGNCDLCFLKSRAKKLAIIRENPGCADWWIGEEVAVTETAKTTGARFTTEYSYADLAREVAQQPHLFDEPTGDDYDAECGLTCAPEEAA